MERALRAQFPVVHMRAQQKPDQQMYNSYSEIRTDFLQYKDKGKEYRKKCSGDVYLIPKQPGYTKAYISCVLDVYELGLTHGRGGIHNLFTQWWDWYPEAGIYLAEDLLESLSQALKLSPNEIIKLNKKDFYSDEEILQAIELQKASK
jgi:hypothetical protein